MTTGQLEYEREQAGNYARKFANLPPNDRARELAGLLDQRKALDDRRHENADALAAATEARRAAFLADPNAKDLPKLDAELLRLERNASDLDAAISDLNKQISIGRAYVSGRY